MHSESEKLTIDNSVLTCIHVLNNTEKYEYVPQGYKENPDDKEEATESFICSKCMDQNAIDREGVMKNLRCVCKECFLEARVKNH